MLCFVFIFFYFQFYFNILVVLANKTNLTLDASVNTSIILLKQNLTSDISNESDLETSTLVTNFIDTVSRNSSISNNSSDFKDVILASTTGIPLKTILNNLNSDVNIRESSIKLDRTDLDNKNVKKVQISKERKHEEIDDLGKNEARIRTVDVELDLGIVRGRVGKTEKNRKIFYGFRAMRYAQPPKRFEASVPVLPWDGVYDATEDRNSCIQIPESDSGMPESEDCLFINVYTPTLPNKTNRNKSINASASNYDLLPVMFWIHGGAQMNGDSSYNYFGPDYFLEENVVVVTLNFRIGVFGFLSTADSACPGNNGLKDILLGLQWVQSHIARFNGNPNNVTIFGESAGAAMVMYLAQSPLTKGKNYFNKVIAQSGNSLCPWSYQRNPRDVANRIAVATLCGFFIFNTQLMLNCLKQVDVNVLKLAALGVFLGDSGFLVGILNGLAFAPNLEPPHENAIVTNKTYELLKSGEFPKIPYILGFNSEEALIVADNLTLLRPLLLQLDAAPAILVPTDMYASFFDSVLNVATQIRNFYFDFAPITLNSNAKIIKYLSDHLFDRPTRESVALLSKHAPVYYYRFSYFGELGLWKTTVEGLGKVQHSADLNYIWRTNTKSFNNTDLSRFSKLDKLVRSRLIKMWTNFAKTGNPTPNEDVLLENKIWPTANAIQNSTDVLCMDIGEHLKLVRNPENGMYTMWKRLYNIYGNPSDTF